MRLELTSVLLAVLHHSQGEHCIIERTCKHMISEFEGKHGHLRLVQIQTGHQRWCEQACDYSLLEDLYSVYKEHHYGHYSSN